VVKRPELPPGWVFASQDVLCRRDFNGHWRIVMLAKCRPEVAEFDAHAKMVAHAWATFSEENPEWTAYFDAFNQRDGESHGS
jgi:hypothetical protein